VAPKVPTGHCVHELALASAYCPMAQMLEVDAPVPRGHAYLQARKHAKQLRQPQPVPSVYQRAGGRGDGEHATPVHVRILPSKRVRQTGTHPAGQGPLQPAV
jgi:hypothetical protein